MLEVGKLTLWLFAVASWAGIFLVGMMSDEDTKATLQLEVLVLSFHYTL